MAKKVVFQDELSIARAVGRLKQVIPVWNKLAKELKALTGETPTKQEIFDFELGGRLLVSKVRQLIGKDAAKFNSPASRAAITAGMRSQLEELERIRSVWRNTITEAETIDLCDVDPDGTISLGESGLFQISEAYSTISHDGSIRDIALSLAETVAESINELKRFMQEYNISLDPVEDDGPGLVTVYRDGAKIRKEYLSMFPDSKP